MTDSKLDFWINKNYNVLFKGKHGVGKAQPLSAQVKIPGGWTTMGQLIVGDLVSTPDGGAAPVKAIYPQGKKEIVRIVFSDGRQAFCCKEHLWKVLSHKGGSRSNPKSWKDAYQWRIQDTQSIIDKFQKNKNPHLYIPLIQPEKMADVNLPLEPYVLGCLLGDGTLSQCHEVRFTTADSFIFNKINKLLPENCHLQVMSSVIGFRVSKINQKGVAKPNPVVDTINKLGLAGTYSDTKFIPAVYKNASASQKIKLLQGLMDTNGYVAKYGSLSYSTSSLQLAQDVIELVQSLGGIAYIVREYYPTFTHNGVKKLGVKHYRITIRYPQPSRLVSLPRKIEKCPKKYQYADLNLKIAKIELTGHKEECQCIEVDHPEHLYITNDYIVTHNTARVLEAFSRNKLRFKYFSTSTLDPWVDFVGVPKEVKDANGNTYLDLIRPKCFADDEIEAIFLDEYNRSQPKVRNATMELLQFKSINGRKFNNLKIIWAAVNPDKEEGDNSVTYDVDVIDPAQMDRFEIQIEVPYKPDYGYFSKKYGTDTAKVAIDWWHELSEEQKNAVSPRRLDYAMRMFMDGGDLRDVLPKQVSTSKLVTELKNGSYREKMLEILKSRDTVKALEFISNKTNFENTIKYIETDEKALSFYMPYMSEENQVKQITESKTALAVAFNAFDVFSKAIHAAAVSSKKVSKLLQEYIKAHPVVMNTQSFQTLSFAKVQFKFNTPLSRIQLTDTVVTLAPRAATAIKSSAERYALYRDLMTAVRENHGYAHNLHGNRPLSVVECEFLLSFLHTVIDHARVLNPLSDINNFYGVVNRAYLAQGKRLSFDTLSAKVKEFITQNSTKYL